MQDIVAIAIIAGLCFALAVREARLRRRIKDLSASLYLALARADRVDASNKIMGDKLKQIAKERANEN
jgi:hypothetical protein